MKWLVIAVVAGCSGTGARIPPPHVVSDARPMIEAWATAVGGRDRIAATGTTHLSGTFAKGGLTGTIEMWESPRGERREDLTLAFLHETRIFDGTHGWLVDRNGEIRALAGFELDDQLALAYFETLAPLVDGRLAGDVTRSGDAVVLAPRGGKRPVTVTFDRATHLPASFARRDGEKQRITQLSDWRTVDGVMLPFSRHEDNGDPNDAVTVRVETLEHRDAPTATFARPADRAPDVTLAGDVTVPIDVAFGGLVFVTAEVAGTPMSFVVDSGAEGTVLNSSRLAKLGLQATGTFAAGAGGGDVVMSYVPHVTTKVGAATLADQIVGAIPLDALEGPMQRPLDGILGYDFLSRFVVELDYQRRTMTLHDRATYRHAGTAIPITLEDSTPYLDASVVLPGMAPVSGHFVLDTGCLCEVQLSGPFTDEHHLLVAVPDAKQSGFSAGAGGVTHEVSATIAALRIGATVIDKPHADFSRDKTGATADPENAGLIGSLVWRRFVLVLDYRRGEIWLDPIR